MAAIKTDLREWRQAVDIYSRGARKTFAETVNHLLQQTGIEGVKIARAGVAKSASIRALYGQHKLIAWLTRRKYGTAPRVSRIFRRDVMKTSAKGKLRRYKSKVRTRGRMVSYTAEEARTLETRHLGRRRSSVGFIRNWFRYWAGSFGVGQITRALTGNQRSGFRESIRYARDGQNIASIAIAYKFTSSLVSPPDRSARETDRLLQRILDRAQRAAIVDSTRYGERKLAQQAAAVSAR